MPSIFISHATADDTAVTRIHDALTAAGIDTWVDHIDIHPGDDWETAIQRALNTCDLGLFVLSPRSANRDECRNEIRALLSRTRLYVALIDTVSDDQFPYRLRTTQYADLRADWDAGLAALIAAILGSRDLDPAAPTTGAARRVSGFTDRWMLDLPLVGRDTDLAAVRGSLANANRVTAVLGLGGIGKTRLAAEIVNTCDFRDGVLWHKISATSTADRLTQQIREFLELAPGLDSDAVWDDLCRRALLIVLDNAEDCTAIEAYAARINGLDLAGGTRVLMTSRREWPALRGVKRITLRAPDRDAAAEIVRIMAAYEAPAFAIDGFERAIADAARRHPRLIWYAVHWANNMPPQDVIAQLNTLHGADAEDALDDLVGKTVAQMAAGEGGTEALAALRKLAVCRGGFTHEAARALLAGDDLPLRPLRAWGLVALENQRYDIDPLVVARVGEDADAVRPHYDYYHALAWNHHERQDYRGLDVESANLEAAFERMMALGDHAAALWLANAAYGYLLNRGRFEQKLNWSERVAAALDEHPDRQLWANAQNSLGIDYQEHPLGDRAANQRRAIACYTAALDHYTPGAAPLAYAMTQNNLGAAYFDLAAIEDRAANLRRAIACYTAALDHYTPGAAPLDYAMTQNNLGNAYGELAAIEDRAANLRRAIACYTAALDHYTPGAAPLDYAMTQRNLGIAHKESGDLPAAIACWREAERYYRQMGAVENADKMRRWIEDTSPPAPLSEGGEGE